MGIRQTNSLDLAFVYVGGAHHIMHSAPVAAFLAKEPDVEVTVYVIEQEEAEEFQRIAETHGVSDIPVRMLSIPSWINFLGKINPPWKSLKLPRLVFSLGRLRQHDALILTERTTTVIRRIPGNNPKLIHIPHGAGDRAKGFEKRLNLFDAVIVAGEKDRQRMIHEGVVKESRCFVSGYVKLGQIEHQRTKSSKKLFKNDRPIILYNPHFNESLSSWKWARKIVDAITADGRFNLIFAPHIRLFSSANDQQRLPWESLAIADKIIVDLGSSRSCDMTYTDASDIYLGDVSSQVYEFISRPRPCIFLSAHDDAVLDGPDYAFHAFGPVIDDLANLSDAFSKALTAPQAYEAQQRKVSEYAFGDYRNAPQNAANVILQCFGIGLST